MSTIDLQQITLEDALNDPAPLSFDAPHRPAVLTTRITCRVCNRKQDIPVLATGLLCDLCRADLDATEAHIRATLAAAEQALTEAWTRWDADLAHASDKDRAFYEQACAAQDAPDYTERYKRALERIIGAPMVSVRLLPGTSPPRQAGLTGPGPWDLMSRAAVGRPRRPARGDTRFL